jgi:radical SAM superfamily enzyme YgiQ (UPF0313 family)
MKILLLLPAAPNLRVTAQDPRVPRRAMLRFSILPLTTVAAITPRGHEVAVLDENVQPLDFAADVDLVGISFMTALAPRAYEIAARFRRRGVLTVAGGFHPTFLPDEAARHFDAVVVGDAEALWPRVVEDAARGRLQKFYRHETRPDLCLTPPPRRDLMAATASHYATINAVQTGRGCTHGCRYCSVTAFHSRTHRSRPLENVLAELKGIPRGFIFVDDNIIADRDYARELFRAMLPLGKRWVSQSSIEIADDPELLALARAAGCRGLFIGVETTSPANLAAVNKSFNDAASCPSRIRRIRRAGIGVIAGIIVGMDGDDPGVFERTLRFLDRTRIDSLQLNIMTPLPGTPLFNDFQAAGRVRSLDWSLYDFRHVVISPAMMTAAQLQDGADWLYNQFYRLDRVILRALRTLWTAGPVPALISLKLNLTYRYDNIRERIVGRNPAAAPHRSRVPWPLRLLRRRAARISSAAP